MSPNVCEKQALLSAVRALVREDILEQDVKSGAHHPERSQPPSFSHILFPYWEFEQCVVSCGLAPPAGVGRSGGGQGLVVDLIRGRVLPVTSSAREQYWTSNLTSFTNPPFGQPSTAILRQKSEGPSGGQKTVPTRLKAIESVCSVYGPPNHTSSTHQ